MKGDNDKEKIKNNEKEEIINKEKEIIKEKENNKKEKNENEVDEKKAEKEIPNENKINPDKKKKEEINNEKNNDKKKEIDITISKPNKVYKNLSTSEEINISFKRSKAELYQILSPDIYRCHLCKELMTTKMKYEGDYINIDYSCPNHHFGSLEIGLFLSKISFFSFIYAKCSKCGKKQEMSKDIFYFCKDCEEIYCPKDINNCRLAKENYVSLEDLDFLCILHQKDYISYCNECSENLCEVCVDSYRHKNHKKYFFKEQLLGAEENENFDKYIQDGKKTKDKLEKEINNLSNKYREVEKIDELILKMINITKEKIQIYGNLIFYLFNIKKSYDFCILCNRYNHQILTNYYELIRNQLTIIDNKFVEINQYIFQLNQKMYFYSLKNDQIKIISNKAGIKIKDQTIKNSNNSIKINPESIINNNNNENKKITIKKYIFEEGEYEGEIRDSLPHGNGKFIYKNGDEYTGEFKNGLFDGNGVHISKKGEKYSGQFKKGKREGNGKCKSENGESYFGYWKDNKRDGQGKYCFSNGDSYQGEFKEDMFNGKGNMFYSNGNRTIGNWENNKKNGKEYLFNNKGEIFYHYYENNTLIQEKKMESNKDFKNYGEEKMIEYMDNYYEKH